MLYNASTLVCAVMTNWIRSDVPLSNEAVLLLGSNIRLHFLKLSKMPANVFSVVKKLSQAGIDVPFKVKVERSGRKSNQAKSSTWLSGQENLYHLILEVGNVSEANISRVEVIRLWHRRIGLADQQAKKRHANHDMTTGSAEKVDQFDFCDTWKFVKEIHVLWSEWSSQSSGKVKSDRFKECDPLANKDQ